MPCSGYSIVPLAPTFPPPRTQDERRNKYDYQLWAVNGVGALPSATKISDGGGDGRLYYLGRGSMAVQVKGGRRFGGYDLE